MAKRFFYVSAAILCLALSYHLGAKSAGAQGGGQLSFAEPSVNDDAVATTSGEFYRGLHACCGDRPAWTLVSHIPVTGAVISVRHVGSNPGVEYWAAYDEAGNYFFSSDDGHTWTQNGNVFSASTPARLESFGSVKARYR